VEKATRERLTGAVILAAVVAIAVPELLSGPGEKAVANDESASAEAGPPLATYDLDIHPSAAPASAARQQAQPPGASAALAQALPPPVIESEKAAPSPSPAAAERGPPATREPAAAQSTGAKPIANQPIPKPPAATRAAATEPAGKWWVQLGSFSSEQNAQRLARELRARGFAIEVSAVSSGGQPLHRVRAGPVNDRDAAATLKTRLGSSGKDAKLVGP
jgi:DedD protein